ncbi:neo-calmodulin-like [Mizuhopecten yessoensis]|uniref:Calmodulin n=1 Tax=Mizuhopecten yessoensis TaxID=6573 RepID=A0A210R6B1_MIZYE|nr:neo-calmodulin-like [Mizuhopecten yessoensis]OWF56448.1 Calmodulin [Mizuhopecten yessoensis]
MAEFQESLHEKELEDAFALFDNDGDGTITIKELGGVMRSLGQNPTHDELKEIMLEADVDGNGYIDKEEFKMIIAKKVSEEDTEEDIREAFHVFDKDGNGYITRRDIKILLARLGDELPSEDIDDMIAEADNDGNGQVSIEEFVEIMQRP